MEVCDILEAVDIVEYISQYCDLELRSDGEFWGCSPLKDERTPSFSVNQEKQTFFDFSTAIGGNLLEFIQEYHKVGLHKAVEILKAYANITNDTVNIPTKLSATKIAKQYKIREKHLQSAPEILPQNYMDRFEWNETKLKTWESEGITKDSMQKFTVRYDGFSDRIVFPIRDYKGNIINVCGRTLDPDFKEKNIRKYTYFKQFNGCLDTLYGFSDNKENITSKKEFIIFEGSKSVMIADGWGFQNTGAALTSHLSEPQFRFLVKLGTRVVFAFDKEIDITKDKNIQRLKRYIPIEYIKDTEGLLNDKDSPVDKGREVFEYLYVKRRILY